MNYNLFLLLTLIFLILVRVIKKNAIYQRIYLLFVQNPKEVCRKFRYYFDNESISCQYLCVKNIPCGSFGNHVIELLRAYQFAKLTGINSVIFQYGFLSQNQSFMYSDIKIEIAKRPYNKYRNYCIPYKFYFPLKKLPRLPFQIDKNFKKWFIQQLPNSTLPDNTLTIHIRSGDVFRKKGYIHPSYGQPPCKYYSDIIKMRNWSQIRIISENEDDPCVNIIRNMGAIYIKNDFKTDLSFLINAKNFVMSRSSLCYVVLLFSEGIENLYTFNQTSSIIPSHFNCIPSRFYIQKVIDHWRNNQEQRNLIMNSSCLKWEYVPKGLQDLHAFLHGNVI